MKLIFLLIGLLYPYAANSEISLVVDKKTQVVKEIIKAAKKENIPSLLLLSVCYTESTFFPREPKMDGNSLSHGICQVKLETALFMDKLSHTENLTTSKDLQVPFINALYAAKYLKYQISRYKDMSLAVDAYNKGTAVSRDSHYVKSVNKNILFVSKKWGRLLL